MTNKIKQILGGIFSSAIIWFSAILLSGKIVSGDVLDLGYSDLGLGKIFLLLFLGYNIFIALYSKKYNKKFFFIFISIKNIALILPKKPSVFSVSNFFVTLDIIQNSFLY